MPSDLEYKIAKQVIATISKVAYRMKVSGLENLEGLKPPYVMAANHHSTYDALLMGMFIEAKVQFLGKKSALFNNKVWSAINNYFGTIPVQDKPGQNTQAINAGLSVLNSGNVLGIFPEGHIVAHKKSFEGKTGVARFAIQAGVPVLPVGILGTEDVLPYPEYGQPPAIWPRIGKKVEVHFRPPLYFDKYKPDDINNKKALRDVTDAIMKEIRIASKGYGCPAPYLYNLIKEGVLTKEQIIN
ncbi:MAG: Bifunctional protein Aas [Candidatus Heimdallarchaeota archaeon LC_3]|nr:MAG: Bifunctional protein Aas [Candidatus Heimdallarchaeota archaeon LC_3]